MTDLFSRLRDDPILFTRMLWPEVRLYREQREILLSVRDNDETYVPAGNALGKDFVAALCALWWFCTRRPARVVTTSVKVDQLEDVLWGEIRRFLATSRVKLPLQYNHLKIRQLTDQGDIVPNAELVGQVSNTQEGLLGRHSTSGFAAVQNDVPRTLVIFDEASGIDDETYDSTQTWAHRKLIIGNPFPCENFFKRGVEAGDVARDHPNTGHHRRVIRITAEHSPNVRLARAEQLRNAPPSNRILIPGVKSWSKYQENRKLWDPILQAVGLDAVFYEGSDILLFPPAWLRRATDLWLALRGTVRQAKSIGIDPAEGGDRTSMAAGDEWGLIELVSKRTPDTNIIIGEAVAFARKHGVQAEMVVFDRGGGGKEHADRLRAEGFMCRTVAFGESMIDDPRRGLASISHRTDLMEDRYAYCSRRDQMYGDLSFIMDPSLSHPLFAEGFAIPPATGTLDNDPIARLRHALSKFPKRYDKEGRMKLPPKNRPVGQKSKEIKTLVDMIGFSPDEADAVVLMVHNLVHRPIRQTAGVY
jgi:hypothetical protein